ncbi:MAG: phage terminase small subunit P27 family [Spirochaetales bacterium]|nr:phage terminase small subunit P27 family [Spirochaetales bacterium]
MPSGGHNRLPSEVKRARGTYRKDRTSPNEPRANKPPKIKVPDYLDKYGRSFYRYAYREMDQMGILSSSDLKTIECTSISYSMMRNALDAIEDKGGLAAYIATAENSQKTPQLSILNKAQEQYLRFSSKLGLNPVDRGRIEIEEKEESDPMASLLKLVK